jgi:hypothetical protein
LTDAPRPRGRSIIKPVGHSMNSMLCSVLARMRAVLLLALAPAAAAAGCTLPPGAINTVLQADPNPSITNATNLTSRDWDRCHGEPARRALAAGAWACRAFQAGPALWAAAVLPWRVLNEPLLPLRRKQHFGPLLPPEDYGPLFAQLALPLVANSDTTDDAVRTLAGDRGVWSASFVDRLCDQGGGDPLLAACAGLSARPLVPNASVTRHEATLAPLELLASRGGSAARHGPSLAVYLCTMLRSVGIPARVATYPQRATLEALNAAAAGAPVLQQLGGGVGAQAAGFDGKVWVEYYAVEHSSWSYIAAVPGAAINSTDGGELAFDASVQKSSAGVFSIWASDWRPQPAGEGCAVCELPPCCNSFRLIRQWTDTSVPAMEVTARYIGNGNATTTPSAATTTAAEGAAAVAAREQRQRLPPPPLPSPSAALEFLKAHRPPHDVANPSLTDEFLMSAHVTPALASLRERPWAGVIGGGTDSADATVESPTSLFLNNILPYAFMDEPRYIVRPHGASGGGHVGWDWRRLFARHYGPLVSAAPSTDAVVWLLDGRNTSLLPDGVWNGTLTDKVCADPEFQSDALIKQCNSPKRRGNHIKFHANQASITKAPFELLRGRNGSCTSTAIFLAAALRSVGVPARVAGTPQWATPAKAIGKLASGSGFQNHDWLEFWSSTHKRWVPHQPKPDRGFLPPTKTSLQLNHSTFGVFSIHATSWERPAAGSGSGSGNGSDGGSHFPLAWDFLNTSVAGVDHTTCYLTAPYLPPPPPPAAAAASTVE